MTVDVFSEPGQGEREQELCPCCGEEPLALGLFARMQHQAQPVPFFMLESQVGPDPAGTAEVEEDLLFMHGRYFFHLVMPLPLLKPETPIVPKLWVEIDRKTAVDIIAARALAKPLDFSARLANDVPGFQGTIGSEVLAHLNREGHGRVTMCADKRIDDLPPDADHETMVSLYRRHWGNTGPVVDADLGLRAALTMHWHKLIDRPVYREPVEPPPALAGLRAAETLIAPPHDTNDPALFATIGCSEDWVHGHLPAELVTRARNPSPDFIKSFSSFAYFSRLSNTVLEPEIGIWESGGIAGAADGMSAWMLREPAFIDPDQCKVDHDQMTVRIIEAVPIYEDETQFLQQFGAEDLLERLAEVDTTDLERESVVSFSED